MPPAPPHHFLCHNRVPGQSNVLIILATKEEKYFSQFLQFQLSVSAHKYEMDANNLDTHMYLLVSTASSSWLQNR